MTKTAWAQEFEAKMSAWREIRDFENKVRDLTTERDALAAQVEQLEEEVLRLHFFDIDVIRCLKTIAFEHNHQDMALYQELAKKCMNDIASRKPLCEIRAEAGRAGFIEGATKQKEIGWCSVYGMQDGANQYAESIRKGGE